LPKELRALEEKINSIIKLYLKNKNKTIY